MTVDDQLFFREAAHDVIEATPGFQAVGEASSGEEALGVVDELEPQLVLMDVRMPDMDGVEATRRIKAAHPEVVVVLISIEDRANIPAAVETAGAVALVQKQHFGPSALRRLWTAHGMRGDLPAPSAVPRAQVIPSGYGPRVAIRVVVGEDSLIMRQGLEQLLASSPTVEVVAACGDLQTLLKAVERERPEVVLTDIRMPPTMSDEGIQLAVRLRESRPETGVVVLSQYSEPEYVLDLLESGSDRRGYLLKERVHDRGQLVSAIDTVAHGGSVIDPKIVEVLVAAKARAERSPLSELTGRERQVLAEIAEGKSNPAIAESLVLTKHAVEKHINSIFMKLGLAAADDVSKRVKATLLFLADSDADARR